MFVLVVAVFNIVIECMFNRISLEHYFLSGRAQDLSAFTVLLSLLYVVCLT